MSVKRSRLSDFVIYYLVAHGRHGHVLRNCVHETSIAFSILETARRLAGSGRLQSIRIAIGELSSVEPDLLRFAWEAVVAGSEHEASELEIEWHPARQFCPTCRQEMRRDPGSWFVECPDCGKSLSVEGGNELEILEISYTEA